MEETNRMAELYLNFKKALRHHSNSLYYDEDDIIDIFDYAGDMNDDHIRLEALLLGYKLFPDSVELIKRRAIFLSDTNDLSFAQMIATNNDMVGDDLIWEILRCSAFGLSSEMPRRIEDLIDKFMLEQDEEIIQFVNLVHKFGQEQWLTDNLDRVISKCQYPNTLMYELARSAESPEQIQSGIALLEKLTEDDPFNADYWSLMADMQSARQQFDEALSSLEYAKALRPDDYELLSLEGYILLQQNRIDQAIPVLEKSYMSHPDNYAIRRNLIIAYKSAEMYDKMREPVRHAFDSDVTDDEMMVEMLVLFPDEIETILQRFHSAPSNHDEASTIERINALCRAGQPSVALRYLRWYADHYPVSQPVKLALLELMYDSKQYEEAYKYLDDNFDGLSLDASELPYLGIIASVLIRNQQYTFAKDFITFWLTELNKISTPNYAYRTLSTGLQQIFKNMLGALDGQLPLDLETVNSITA